jgi:hypothetical protein
MTASCDKVPGARLHGLAASLCTVCLPNLIVHAGGEAQRLSWLANSRSRAAVKGDHREPRTRACPLAAVKAKRTRFRVRCSLPTSLSTNSWVKITRTFRPLLSVPLRDATKFSELLETLPACGEVQNHSLLWGHVDTRFGADLFEKVEESATID